METGPSRESELKQQGALEAARDPDSSVTSEDAERLMVDEAKKSGAQAFQFDPNATAAEKAQQARARIPPGLKHERKPNAAILATDIDDGTGTKYDIPTSSKDSAIAAPDTPTSDKANGKVPDSEEARWAKVGWQPRFGMPGSLAEGEEEDTSTLLDHQTWLEGRLDDKFFGDWYHNTGIIIFACLASWVVALVGGGLGWVFLIMAFCGTYYRTSIRRVRRNYRDDVNRELAKQKIENDHESLEWINSFLVKFWPIYAPVICETIVNSVDQVLSTATPAFLDSLRLKSFTLGTKPPRLEYVKSYPKAQDDIVLMDWRFSFTPNDVADLTSQQIKNKINPKIVLEVRVGKGIVSKGLDVIVEDMACSGLMRVKFKLQLPFPHIEKVDICFLERPQIDYVCKPLGGENFGFDINFIPFLETFIMEQVHGNLGPMMYDPNVFPIEIAKMLAGNPVDQAIGVLQVTFHGAQGLKNPDKFSGTPDPYALVSINHRQELARTKTVHENANPRWNETKNIIITSLKDALTIQVFDYNDIRKDKELGTATFQLSQLEEEDEHENLHLEVIANGRPRGAILCDIRFFPVLEGTKLDDQTIEPPPESMTGIVKFTVEQAKELDGTMSMIGQLNPYAVLLLNGIEVQVSKKLKRTNNPIWQDATKELLITDRKKAKLGLIIKDDRNIATDPIIGQYQIKLDDMLELMERGQEWYHLQGVKSGRVKMRAQWKPVALKGALAGSGGYVTPIGVMRVHFQSARDLRNVETMGKSDPYARVLLSGIEKGRTVTFKNNLNPEWDEVVYVPVHTTRERLVVEVMDEENLGKDRSLGHFEIACSEYIHQDDNGEYRTNDAKEVLQGSLHMGPRTTPKGILNYTCSFFPTIPVVDPDDEEKERSSLDSPRKSLETVRKSGETDRKSIENATAPPSNRSSLTRNGTIPSLKSHKTNGSVDLAKKPDAGEAAEEEVLLPEKKEREKLRLNTENISEHETGLIIFKLIEGKFAQSDCYLEVIMDDMMFPSWISSKIKSKAHVFNEVGDAIVRELDFSKITLRIIEKANKKGEDDEDHVIAKLTGSTLDTLRRCLYQPTVLTIRDNDGRENKVTVSLKYIPVTMTLDPSESFNNQGTLRVDVLDAADLPAADRNGYSDPYCKFYLNGKDVFKTKVQKKTLHPAWNEFFEVSVKSRTAAKFEVTVFDWDFGDKADLLGKATINLDILEPFASQEVVLGLDGKSGALKLKLLFKPDYVVRSRQGSSTFHGTFATPGKVIGAPVKGVGKGAVFVGSSVIKAGTFLGKSFKFGKGKDDDDDESAATASVTMNDSLEPPRTSGGDGTSTPVTSSPHSRQKSMAHSISSQVGLSPGGAEVGTANITVLSATGYPPNTNVRVFVKMPTGKGDKEVHKTKHIKSPTGEVSFGEQETFKVNCAADTQFKVLVKDHSTFGSGDDLGEGIFFVDDQGIGSEKPIKCGAGSVVLRSSFQAADQASTIGGGGLSPGGNKLRRSVFGTKRDSRSREGTPS